MKTWLLALAALLVSAMAHTSQVRAEAPPVVVELFTSQGCYSCPPADSLLGELAAADGVVAIGYHVTYWDRLGWPDPFATRWGTERQYAYAGAQGSSRVYTPQMIIDGRRDVVGSHAREVRAQIESARAAAKPATPVLTWQGGNPLRIVLPEAPEAEGASLWLIRFDERRVTDILRGENGGKRLAYHHIARERIPLGLYQGHARTIELAVQPGDTDWGVAVLVQDDGPGRIWGAARLRAP